MSPLEVSWAYHRNTEEGGCPSDDPCEDNPPPIHIPLNHHLSSAPGPPEGFSTMEIVGAVIGAAIGLACLGCVGVYSYKRFIRSRDGYSGNLAIKNSEDRML
ncbi:hypothetical protein DPEC_G00012130 [Dallia pectoralis]|uniref:Uncharacterized protein n=1 Tax=Dallia pectoralis TaxID=75939 RepID=A0ACC2HN52_DALPE|nr:hypothetical protein DPEC_G00012130 [Dallia pectoralis]